jgi:hypothetical protein
MMDKKKKNCEDRKLILIKVEQFEKLLKKYNKNEKAIIRRVSKSDLGVTEKGDVVLDYLYENNYHVAREPLGICVFCSEAFTSTSLVRNLGGSCDIHYDCDVVWSYVQKYIDATTDKFCICPIDGCENH